MEQSVREKYEREASHYLQMAATPGITAVEKCSALIRAGLATFALARPEKSAAIFEQAMVLEAMSRNDEFACTIKLIECYSQMKEPRLLMKCCNRALERFPEVEAEWLFYRSTARHDIEGNDAALEDLDKAQRLAAGTTQDRIDIIRSSRVARMIKSAIEKNDLEMIRAAAAEASNLLGPVASTGREEALGNFRSENCSGGVKAYAHMALAFIHLLAANTTHHEVLKTLQKEKGSVGYFALKLGFTLAYKTGQLGTLCDCCQRLFQYHLIERHTSIGVLPATRMDIQAPLSEWNISCSWIPLRKKDGIPTRVEALCEIGTLFAMMCHERNEESLAAAIWSRVLKSDEVSDELKDWCVDALELNKSGKDSSRELWGRYFVDTSKLEQIGD